MKTSLDSKEAINRLGHFHSEACSLCPHPTAEVDLERFWMHRSTALAYLAHLFGHDHHIVTDFERTVARPAAGDLQCAQGILSAAQQIVHSGWTESVKTLVSGEIFSDFLDMADHLLTEGYKDAAMVIAGSVLEEHLRRLCSNHQIPLTTNQGKPKKADTMNAELLRANVYSTTDQKAVTAWLGLRNEAAHGHYQKYTAAQTRLMIDGIIDFTARVPA